MKAVYLKAPLQIGMTDTDYPAREEGFALIAIKAASICGSDVAAYRGVNPLVSYPRVLGHEAAGEVLEISENEKGIKPGDRVILEPYVYCGKCYPCSIGRTNCCEKLEVLGVHRHGAMAEAFSHPAHLLHRFPDEISWQQAPLAEPLTIALHSLHRARVSAGEFVTVFGAGPIGLLAGLAAMAYNAKPIIIDIIDERLDYAKSLGMSVINSAKQNSEDAVRDITGGMMSQSVIEASGANQAIQDCFKLVSFAGRIAFTGWPKKLTELNTGIITRKELDVLGSRNSAREFPEAIELIASGRVDVLKVLTKTVPFEELANAVTELSEKPQDYLKISSVF